MLTQLLSVVTLNPENSVIATFPVEGYGYRFESDGDTISIISLYGAKVFFKDFDCKKRTLEKREFEGVYRGTHENGKAVILANIGGLSPRDYEDSGVTYEYGKAKMRVDEGILYSHTALENTPPFYTGFTYRTLIPNPVDEARSRGKQFIGVLYKWVDAPKITYYRSENYKLKRVAEYPIDGLEGKRAGFNDAKFWNGEILDTYWQSQVTTFHPGGDLIDFSAVRQNITVYWYRHNLRDGFFNRRTFSLRNVDGNELSRFYVTESGKYGCWIHGKRAYILAH
ncbi:MAG: hypothetical protein KDC26_07620 [Armatimonadetes bacterium]|nr:hypothetical protein [Armatimonadota bacterium]